MSESCHSVLRTVSVDTVFTALSIAAARFLLVYTVKTSSFDQLQGKCTSKREGGFVSTISQPPIKINTEWVLPFAIDSYNLDNSSSLGTSQPGGGKWLEILILIFMYEQKQQIV